MNKEPLALYIFRYIVGFGLFFFMAMLYWSSLLLEENINGLKAEITQLKSDVYTLHTDSQRISQTVVQALLDDQNHRDELLKAIWSNTSALEKIKAGTPIEVPSQDSPPPAPKQTPSAREDRQTRSRAHIDASLPNLLQEDPFYAVTLPKVILPPDFRPLGTQQEATIGKPDNLHPFANWREVSTWQDLCLVSLATMEFGKYETMAPDMAIKMEERKQKDKDVPEYWLHLRNDVYWQPLNPLHISANFQLAPQFLTKHQVTAHDYKFYWDALMNPFVQVPGAVSLRNYLGDIEEIEVVDDLTLIVRWKTHDVTLPSGEVVPKIKYIAKGWTGALRPLPRFVYQYFPDGKKIVEDDDPNTYRTNSVWAQNFGQHWARNIIVSCGAWTFDGMTDRQIGFRRNADFSQPLRALSERIEVAFKESPDAVWIEFKNGKLDTYALQPDQFIELDNFVASDAYKKQVKEGLKINQLQYLARAYTYIGWNEARPFFASRKVRLAMTLAIDRQRIIRQNLNGMGEELSGPFFKASPSYDTSVQPWPYDPVEARRLLEEEGWYDSTGSGVVDKEINGKRIPFRFSLTYYVKNPTAKAVSEYVSTALKAIGVECQLNGVDIADLSAVFDDKNFDALLMGWALGTPPEEPRQLWHSAGAREKGSSNAIGFSNADVDKIIDELQYEYDKDKRRALYHRLHRLIHEEQPYTFLYIPKTTLLYRDYVQNVFIPKDRQDLVPGANVATPETSVFYLKPHD